MGMARARRQSAIKTRRRIIRGYMNVCAKFWHAYSEAMPVPVTEYRKMVGNGPDMMLRHKFPRLKIEVQDNCSFKQLADALRASSEYAKRLKTREENPVDETFAEEFAVSLSPEIAEAVRELAKADKMSPEDVISAIVEDYVMGEILNEEEEL